MTCREFTEFLADYLADEVSPEQRQVFEQHVKACPDCANYLASYRHTIEMSRSALTEADGSVPAPVPEALVRAVLDARVRRDG